MIDRAGSDLNYSGRSKRENCAFRLSHTRERYSFHRKDTDRFPIDVRGDLRDIAQSYYNKLHS